MKLKEPMGTVLGGSIFAPGITNGEEPMGTVLGGSILRQEEPADTLMVKVNKNRDFVIMGYPDKEK